MIQSMEKIASINHFNLWSFDLNLLVAFDALYREGSVSRAAERLKIQQPAMSHNLSTLRMLLQDELFVRVGRNMQPTDLSMAIAGPIEQLLAQASQVLNARPTFDPVSDHHTFKVGFSNAFEVLVMPDLAARISAVGPGLSVQARWANPEQVYGMLDDGAIDMAVGRYGPGSLRHRSTRLFTQSLMCCYNPKLVPIRGRLDRATYLAHRHALVSQRDNIKGCLDLALAKSSVELDVALSAPEFLTVLSTVRSAPLIATLPTRIVEKYAAQFGLVTNTCPLEMDPNPVCLVSAAHTEQSPAAQWLRSQILDVLGLEHIEAEAA